MDPQVLWLTIVVIFGLCAIWNKLHQILEAIKERGNKKVMGL